MLFKSTHQLKLKEQKTEALLCGLPSRRESNPVDCLAVGEASILFCNIVKTQGVHLDADLSFDQHVSSVVRSMICWT